MIERKRDTSKKRQTILDAAQQAFIEDGYENTSMDRIAELAGASKRTVYNHFSSKEELFQAVIERLLRDAYALKQIPYDPGNSLEAQLTAFADAKLTFTQNDTWMGMMTVTAGVFSTHPELARKAVRHAEDESDALASWLTAAHLDGRMNVPDAAEAATIFWAMVSGAFFWPAIFHCAMPGEQVVRLKKEMIDMFLQKYGAKLEIGGDNGR